MFKVSIPRFFAFMLRLVVSILRLVLLTSFSYAFFIDAGLACDIASKCRTYRGGGVYYKREKGLLVLDGIGVIVPGPSNEQIYLHLHDLSSNARISVKRANTGETSTFFKRDFFCNP